MSKVSFKPKNKPRTVVEKYEFLRAKNKSLDTLKELFNLEIKL